MALNTQVKNEITSILYDGLKEKIENYQKAEDMEKPFYYCLFTTKTVDLAAILQSAYTWFGSQWEKIVVEKVNGLNLLVKKLKKDN